jgi:hypothetical protein
MYLSRCASFVFEINVWEMFFNINLLLNEKLQNVPFLLIGSVLLFQVLEYGTEGDPAGISYYIEYGGFASRKGIMS